MILQVAYNSKKSHANGVLPFAHRMEELGNGF